jgi:hypothetical protein
MLVCHGLTVAGLVTLGGEAWRTQARARVLQRAEADSLADPESWPRQLLGRALAGRLVGLYGQVEIDQRLDEAAALAASEHARRWWPHRVFSFFLPMLGFIEGWKNVRAETNVSPLEVVFLPWLVAIVEACLWLALATWLAFQAQAVYERWRALAHAVITPDSSLLRAVLGAPVATVSSAAATAVNGEPASAETTGDATAPPEQETSHEDTPPAPEYLGSIFDQLFEPTRRSTESREDVD